MAVPLARRSLHGVPRALGVTQALVQAVVLAVVLAGITGR